MKEEKMKIKYMQQRLIELKEYMRTLRLQSAIYDTKDEQLQVQDDLMEYVHYTKSVIDCRKRTVIYEDPVLYAMEKQEQHHQYQKQQQFRFLCLLQAIYQLPSQDCQLLLDYYVRDVHRYQIMNHLGIVESTFYRRHEKALLRLSSLLASLPQQ